MYRGSGGELHSVMSRFELGASFPRALVALLGIVWTKRFSFGLRMS